MRPFRPASVGWRIINEDFMKNQNIFSDLKKFVQAMGRREIYRAPIIPLMTSSTYRAGQYMYDQRRRLLSWPGLEWDGRQSRYQMGIDQTTEYRYADVALFANRLRATVDYYDKHTTNLIYTSNSAAFFPAKVNVVVNLPTAR